MGIPDEDRGPTWLRDWAHIEADIKAMEDFAIKLRAEVEGNYAPHLAKVRDDMVVPLPPPSGGFSELVGLMLTHQQSQQATSDMVHHYANATGGMANAASDISKEYGQSDAFSAAQVTGVSKALDDNGVTAPGPGTVPAGPPGSAPPGSPPVAVPADPGSQTPTGGR